MPRPKGYPKTGGRQSGALNKRQTETLDRLFEICEEVGVDPFRQMLEIANDMDSMPELRLSALKEVCQYLYPKRKAIEHSGEIKNPYLEKSVDELEQIVLGMLGEKKNG